ncbi:MAG: multidrug efflux SMR transporter [Pseudomonadota bacterium]
MSWILLLVAGLLETGWATSLKISSGKPGLLIIGATIVMLAASLFTLAITMRDLPLGVAYPIWTGIGTIGSVVLGVLFFKETLPPSSIAGVACLCLGIALISMKAA